MPKYAVTTVFYLECDDEDQVKNTTEHLIDDSCLYKDKGEDWQIVSVDEVESF